MIFLSQGSRGEREIIKKYSPLSRTEREMDFLFSRFEKRTRNFKKHSPLSRIEIVFSFLKVREESEKFQERFSTFEKRKGFFFERRSRNFE